MLTTKSRAVALQGSPAFFACGNYRNGPAYYYFTTRTDPSASATKAPQSRRGEGALPLSGLLD
jgi:hypothetical protein